MKPLSCFCFLNVVHVQLRVNAPPSLACLTRDGNCVHQEKVFLLKLNLRGQEALLGVSGMFFCLAEVENNAGAAISEISVEADSDDRSLFTGLWKTFPWIDVQLSSGIREGTYCRRPLDDLISERIIRNIYTNSDISNPIESNHIYIPGDLSYLAPWGCQRCSCCWIASPTSRNRGGLGGSQCGNMVRFGSIRYCSKSGSGWRSHRWCCTKHIGGVNCFLSFNSDGFWIGRLLQRLVILWPSSACNMLWTIQLGPWRRISLGKLNIYNEYMSHMSDSVVDRLKDSSSAINNPPNSCELVEAFLHVF